jgi:hypothetical protein
LIFGFEDEESFYKPSCTRDSYWTFGTARACYQLMHAFAGGQSKISFEGRIAGTELLGIEGAMLEETPVLKRNTTSPRQDFIVLPLTPASFPIIEDAIKSKIAFSAGSGIIHVQIENSGRLVFAAYDEFHPDTTVVSGLLTDCELSELVSKRVLRCFRPSTKT